MIGRHKGPDFGPLFIGLLGIMAGMVVVAIYQFINSRCCKNLRGLPDDLEGGPQILMAGRHDTRAVQAEETARRASRTVSSPTTQSSCGGSMTFKCKGAFGEGTCAVCLCDFGEGEEIRVIPECGHSFHVECIDMWLFSHSNCPLCRTKTDVSQHVVDVVLPVPHQ